MSRTYELWDIETGNLVGEFPSFEDALDVVKTLLDANGIEIANAVVLQCREERAVVRTVGPGSRLVEEVAARLKTERTVPATA